MLNHITIMGRLTRDPVLRYTQSQTPVASFSLAVERDFGKEGREREVDFINCVAWRNTAEFVNRYFKQGSMAVVSGRLQIRRWQDQNGNNRDTAEVVVDNIYFGSSKRDDVSSNQGQSYTGSQATTYNYSAPSPDTGAAFEELSSDEDDLPF